MLKGDNRDPQNYLKHIESAKEALEGPSQPQFLGEVDVPDKFFNDFYRLHHLIGEIDLIVNNCGEYNKKATNLAEH